MNKDKLPTLLFALAILVFLIIIPIFTNKVFFADTTDYLGVARYLHGDLKSIIRNTHSWDYGYFLSFFLKIWNSITLLRVINSVWLILTALVLYKLNKNKNVLFLWFFSPIVWYLAPYIHPLPMATFFLTLSYYYIKKYEENKSIINLLFSGFLLGVSALVWDAVLILSFFFIVSFFFNKRLYEAAYFIVAFGISFSIKLLTDYLLFGIPLFSTFRQLGSTLLFALRKVAFEDDSGSRYLLHFIPINLLLYLVIISPLFFMLYKSIRKEKEEFAFVLLVFGFFLLNNQPRYALIIAPIALLLISRNINKKLLVANCIISVFLIGFVFHPAFSDKTDKYIGEDLKKIGDDFSGETFLSGSSIRGQEDDYLIFSTLYYGGNIKEFVSWQDYNLDIKNETVFYEVKFDLDKKKTVNELRSPYIKLGMDRNNNRDYSEIKYLISREKETELKNFELVKEYKILNVFKKARS